MDPVMALKTLQEGVQLLDGTNWWVSAGTALCIHRNGLDDEFLFKDTDIDVEVEGIGIEEIEKRYMNAGFRFHVKQLISGIPSQLALIKNDIIFDIYFYHREVDNLVNINPYGRLLVPAHLIDNAKMITIRDIELRIPFPIEEYLTVRYGDWQVSKAKVSWWWEQANNMVRS